MLVDQRRNQDHEDRLPGAPAVLLAALAEAVAGWFLHWQRSAGGTWPRTCSMCIPHPL